MCAARRWLPLRTPSTVTHLALGRGLGCLLCWCLLLLLFSSGSSLLFLLLSRGGSSFLLLRLLYGGLGRLLVKEVTSEVGTEGAQVSARQRLVTLVSSAPNVRLLRC